MHVTIQYQEAQKPNAWATACKAEVLYADSKVIVVRGAGAESMFDPKGEVIIFRSSRKNVVGARLPTKIGRVRLHPKSLARLQES